MKIAASGGRWTKSAGRGIADAMFGGVEIVDEVVTS
jgi:hypothetical protein